MQETTRNTTLLGTKSYYEELIRLAAYSKKEIVKVKPGARNQRIIDEINTRLAYYKKLKKAGRVPGACDNDNE